MHYDEDVDDQTVEEHAEGAHEIGEVVHPFVHFFFASWIFYYYKWVMGSGWLQMGNKIIKQMEQRQISKSEEKIQKMNSSMVAFRELIESLRLKNQQLVKPATSEINPESESSSQSRLYASQRTAPNTDLIKVVHNLQGLMNTNPSPPASAPTTLAIITQDEGIKLKARGHVAGRDIINKKPTVLPAQKFNQTVINNREHARNKNLELSSSFVNEKDSQLPSLEHVKLMMNRHNSNKEERMETKKESVTQPFTEGFKTQLNKTMTTMPLNKPKFQQNKLNVKAIATRNKIKDIDEQLVIKYCKEAKQLRQSSQASQIFDYFQGLMAQANVAIISPFIKKFKNCIYFGAPVSEDDSYEGFLYFYESKIYYGEFLRNQKNGKGVEILIDQEAVYKGIFKQGQKTGKFLVKKYDEHYIGLLEKGEYHGQGKLETKESIYEGQFQNGDKHGFGEEFFPKTGVRMTGYFDRGVFSKRSKSSFSHSEIEKGIKFKIPVKTGRSNGQTKKFSSTSRLPSDQMEGTSGFSPKEPQQTEQDLYAPPFSSSANQLNFRKTPFNKQKIRSFLPGMSNHKFIDPMPENCRDFDYSFDVSSKKDSENFIQFGQSSAKARVYQERERKNTVLQFGQIQEQNHHLDTSALEEPLPMPCFFKK